MKSYDLGNDNIKKLVFSLAIPSLVAQLVNVLYSIVDRIYIGNIKEVGDLALAGVGVCGPLVTFISSFGSLIGMGGSILLAMYIGAGDKEKARKILANSFYALLVLSLSLTLIFSIIGKDILMPLGTTVNTYDYALTYLKIYVFGTLFQLMAIGLNYFITAQGLPKQAMTSVIIGAITNIILDTVFVLYLEMGVAGAAYATVIAQILSFIYTLKILTSKKVEIKLSILNLDLTLIKKIITLGLNPFIIISTDSLMILLFNIAIKNTAGDLVDVYIASSAVVNSIFMLLSAPLAGITGGTQPIISFNHGKKDRARVKEATKYIFLLGISFNIFMFIFMNVFARELVMLFNSNPAVIEESVRGLRIYILMIIPLICEYCFADAITALGLVKYSLCLSMFRKGSYVVSSFILAYTLGASTIFFAEPICDFLSTIASSIVFTIIMKKYMQGKIGYNL